MISVTRFISCLSCSLSVVYTGVLNDVLNLILHRLTGSSCVRASSDHQQKGKMEEEQAKEKLSQKAFQFLAAFARLVPFVSAYVLW